MDHSDEREHIRSLIGDHSIAMMTTHDVDGMLVSRPMALQLLADDDVMWFFTDDGEPKTQQLEADPRVGLTFHGGAWVSIQGKGSVVKDPAKPPELWNPMVAAWMPCEPDDPKVALIKVAATGGQYWRGAMGTLPTLIKMVGAKVTGFQPEDEPGTGKADLGS